MESLIIRLILAHLIGDFLLQPQKWVNEKRTNGYRSKEFWYHILIHTVSLVLLLLTVNIQIGGKLKVLGVIVLSHIIIDVVKSQLDRKNRYGILLFLIDQLFHGLSIGLAVFIIYPFRILDNIIYSDEVFFMLSSLILVTFGIGVLIKVFLTKWGDIKDEFEEVNSVGFYIGILERLLVFYFVISGLWTGIGFLLTAKSVLRFGTLSNSKEKSQVEYILVGTLLSFILAIASALLYLYLEPLLVL